MKNLIIIPILLLAYCGFAQRTLSYAQCDSVAITSMLSNGDVIDTFIMKDSSRLYAGLPLKLGKPFNNGENFTYVVFGEYTIGKAFMGSIVMLNKAMSMEEVVLTAIKVGHTKLNKNSPVEIYLYVTNPKLGKGANNRTIFKVERAIETGELINPNSAMTKEQAIAKLKEYKSLLDLGVITNEEYEKHKAELSKIILGN